MVDNGDILGTPSQYSVTLNRTRSAVMDLALGRSPISSSIRGRRMESFAPSAPDWIRIRARD
jgi:hypothetical protein